MTTTMVVRPTLQQMVKQAMVEGVRRSSISAEAAQQAENLGEKTAEKACEKCGKEKCSCMGKQSSVSTEYALKFASALEYGLTELAKQASASASKVQPGQGPGALAVSQATQEGAIKEDMGQATAPHIIPLKTGLQSAHGEAASQVPNDLNKTPGGSQKQKTAAPLDLIASMAKAAADEKKDDKEKDGNFPGLANLKGVVASVPRPGSAAIKAPTSVPRPTPKMASAEETGADNLVDYLLSATKQAEDAINPAKISAGKAVPPEASASGEPGGQPAGGKPRGPTGLIASNDAARNFTKGQAYAGRKEEMKAYINEPMMSAEHDKALANAFSHTGQAGTKISSAQPDDLVKAAAGRALLQKLAAEADAKATTNASAQGA